MGLGGTKLRSVLPRDQHSIAPALRISRIGLSCRSNVSSALELVLAGLNSELPLEERISPIQAAYLTPATWLPVPLISTRWILIEQATHHHVLSKCQAFLHSSGIAKIQPNGMFDSVSIGEVNKAYAD